MLIQVEPDGTASIAADGLGFPNGMVITPDGGTLIVAESMLNRLSAFDVKNGKLGERRTWASFGDAPDLAPMPSRRSARSRWRPTASASTPKVPIWVADAAHARLIRVVEGGEIVDER